MIFCGYVMISLRSECFCPTGAAWDVAAPHRVGATIWFRSGLVLSRLSHPFPSPFSPFSLFPVCRLVRCSELANSAVGVVLVARMTLLLMGSCQTPPAYGEANDLLDGWAAMDISAPRVSGVEWRLRRAQCRPVRVHGTPDRDGI